MQAPRLPFVIAGVGALAYLAWHKRDYILPDGRIAERVGLSGKGYAIINPERLSPKARPELLRFLIEWQRNGPFPLMIPKGGGDDRTEADVAANLASGASRATSLRSTPHGRGAAVDLYPALLSFTGRVSKIYLPERPKDGSVPSYLIRPDLFEIIGRRAERAGLEWGGRWPDFKDFPHVQVRNWKQLPFPAV